MRRTENLRRMIRETRLAPEDFIYPLFVVPGSGVAKPIGSLPGQFNFSVDKAVDAARGAADLGIPARDPVRHPRAQGRGRLRGVERERRHPKGDPRDQEGAPRADRDGRRVLLRVHRPRPLRRAARRRARQRCVAREPRAHGRQLREGRRRCRRAERACSMASSARAARASTRTASIKSRSWRTPRSTRRRTTARSARPSTRRRKRAIAAATRWTTANVAEAMREVSMDVAEGADIVMVKPALAYLDVIRAVSDEVNMPVARVQRQRRVRDDRSRRRAGLDRSATASSSRR